MRLRSAAWNMYTQLNFANRHERKTAIIGHEAACYNNEIAAVSEARLL